MATAQKKNAGGKRTASGTGRTASGSRAAGSRKKAPAPRPIRREVGAVACLLLAIFSAFGYFHIQAIFIDFFCGLVKGLIGYGYWLLPPMLLVASGILVFHRGRPVRLRVWCALLTPVLVGCLLHLILTRGSYEWSLELVKTLWSQGEALKSGGVVSGSIALGLTAVFSKYGAGVIFVLIAAIMLMVVFHVSPVDIVDRIRERPRVEYEEEELPEPKPRERRRAPEPESAARRQQVPQIDIPVDDGPLVGKRPEPKPIEKKERFFNRKPSVPTPDQVLAGAAAGDVPEAEPIAVSPPPETPQEAAQAAKPVPEPIPEPAPAPPVPEIEREPAVAKVKREEAAQAAAEVAQDIARKLEEGTPAAYQYPPVSLLNEGAGVAGADVASELQANQARLSDTIRSFGIDATIANVTRGPSVTRYEVELDQGVRLNKLTNLADDIALALGATGVRIAPIPDKISMVGIEVPNKLVSPVYIHDVIDSSEFRDNPSKVSFAVGRDISNRNVVGNIAKLPHLLIAGTTGSGKSVMINSIITALLMRTLPDDVRLIMVDPKRVELSGYNGLPHLYVPVVTEPKQAASALQWAVSEMERRLKVFERIGVRKISTFNEKQAAGEFEQYDNPPAKMPYLVIIIDELSDLMMVAGKDVEASIVRIAQLGRAAGIHLIVATQRPSSNVVTGLIKANITNRIAFNVATGIDSRVIIDQMGAEKLTGYGDMLFSKVDWGKPKRIQGCFVSDDEINGVVAFVKEQGAPDYHEEILSAVAPASMGGGGGGGFYNEPSDDDPLLWDAAKIVVESQLGSTSGLQRRLKVGYARAGRIMDMLEEKGVVGPPDGSKPREVLLDEEGLEALQSVEAQLAAEDEGFGGR